MATSSTRRPLLWLRAGSQREIVRAHLRHVAGRFTAGGWEIHEGGEPPPSSGATGPLAVLDDPWAEPLPEVARRLADAASAVAPAWRAPRVNGGPGEQAWSPRWGPYTLREYRRRARGGWAGETLRMGIPPWTGFAAAPAGEAAELLERGWPPAAGDVVVVTGARLYRYHDPADHERRELDPWVPEEARTILDVGCGHGRLGERLRRPGRRVIGIEPDPAMAAVAAGRLDRVLTATAEEALPALEGPLDCVIFADVLEHTSDPARLLALAAERLAPGGRVVASLPNSAWAPVLRDLAAGLWEPTLAGVQARDHRVPFTPVSFARLAAECGLTVIRTQPLPAPLPRRLRLWAWLAARTTGGDPRHLVAPQWIAVLCRAEEHDS